MFLMFYFVIVKLPRGGLEKTIDKICKNLKFKNSIRINIFVLFILAAFYATQICFLRHNADPDPPK